MYRELLCDLKNCGYIFYEFRHQSVYVSESAMIGNDLWFKVRAIVKTRALVDYLRKLETDEVVLGYELPIVNSVK